MQNRIEAYYDHFPPENMNVSVSQTVIQTGDGHSVRKNILIVNKDIEKDEEIYMENPVVVALDPDIQTKGSNCSNCLRKLDSAKPLNINDPLHAVYCSEACQARALAEWHNILFGPDPLPDDASKALPEHTKQARRAAQESFVANLNSSGMLSPLLVAKFIARQVSAEMAKIASGSPGVDGRGAFSEGEYSLSDHIERLRYLELPPQEQESKLIANLLETTMPGLEQSIYDEKYTVLKGKMIYNTIGICFAVGGSDDNFTPKDTREDREMTRTPHGTEHQIGCGLYPVSAYMSHSCRPSVRQSFLDGTSTLHLIANHPLKKGDELTMAYVDVSQRSGQTVAEARLRRRQELARGWRFACSCPRCVEEAPEGEVREKIVDESKVETVYSRYEDNRTANADTI